MSWLEKIEDAIVTRLKEVIPQGVAAVEPFPEDVKNHQLKHSKGAVLVSYAGGKYGLTESTGAINQPRRIHFDLMIRHRHRRGHQGAYALIENVRMALTGFQAEGSTKFVPLADGFLFQKDAVWNYHMQVAAEIPNVECPGVLPMDELGGANLVHITDLNPDLGNLEVPA